MTKTLTLVFAFLLSLMSANILSTSAFAQDFSTKTDFTTGNTPYSVSIGDLNGDEKLYSAAPNNGATNTDSVYLT